MEALVARLTNLSYEIFGVFVPGFIGGVFLIATWWALGSIPVELSNGIIPKITYHYLAEKEPTRLDLLIIATALYFIGHLLFWLSRNHGDEVAKGRKLKVAVQRIWRCLLFRIPRPKDSYFAHYQEMLNAVAEKFGIPVDDRTWSRFYPLAKITLSHKLARSLTSTYQNKYTLHRSITAAAALLFWTNCGVALLFGVLWLLHSSHHGLPLLQPRWPGVWANLSVALLVIWGFSDSFAYNWIMWGNSIITETYAVVCGMALPEKKQGSTRHE